MWILGGVEKLWGGDFLACGGIPGCALRNGPLFSGSLRNSVSAKPFPFLAFVAFGTRKGLLRYGIDTRCAKQPPVVRDAFSEALRAQNRLLGYGREIRYQKHPSTVRGAVHSSFRGALHQKNKTTKAAIASAAFVDLKAKYKYLILLQGS